MGNSCTSGDANSKAEAAKNRAIDADGKAIYKKESQIHKILLLGAGESGKSTIFKQMKILHQAGYTEDEAQTFVSTVHNNTIHNIRDLVEAAPSCGRPLDDGPLAAAAARVQEGDNNQPLRQDLVDAIKELWASEEIQEVYKQRSKFQLADSAQYYFDKVDEIAKPNYIPSAEDILRTRVRTSGIVETSFQVEGIKFKMFDVGGQRNERRKWIHCFDNVNAVLFVAALSEYDQVLYEDENQNRMREALSLFAEICNSRFFHETSMILFLNKTDLFQEKIKHSPLNVCFKDYTGGNNYEEAIAFLTQQFLAVNKIEDKTVYVHQTCATDSNNVRFVFEAVKDICLQSNLRGSGFI